MKKQILKLKSEFIYDLYEEDPELFNIVDIKEKRNNKTNYTKLMKQNYDLWKILLEKLGVVYIGYLTILMNSIDYSNKIDFKELRRLGVKEGMINVIKKKLVDSHIIKKHFGDFYINPTITMKGTKLDSDIEKLFDNCKICE